MSTRQRPRLVYERWTDPVAGDILELSDIEVVKLDLSMPEERGWAALESAHGYQVATRTDVAGIEAGAQWLAGPELIKRCENLLAVCSAGAGYDVIDVEAHPCRNCGVQQLGPRRRGRRRACAGLHARPGEEDHRRRPGTAQRSARRPPATAGQPALRQDSRRCRARRHRRPFGRAVCSVRHGGAGLRPVSRRRVCRRPRVRRVTLTELVERSDFVQVTCPLTAETQGLIGAEQFAAMKSTAFFITTARGPVHDEDALLQALETGSIAGAGLDVFHEEPPRQDNPLLRLENVVATPHTAGITVEAAGHRRRDGEPMADPVCGFSSPRL